ncbi:MAG: type II toxin-antitoxin system VapC family toxin [Pseudomonas sp.]
MLLLDTHIWIRWLNAETGNQALPMGLVDRIETAECIAISAISCWELGQLVKRQRVQLSMPLDEWLELALEGDIQVLPVDRHIATRAAALPEHHRDPADRMIIATALLHDAALVSLDSAFPQYTALTGRLIRQ